MSATSKNPLETPIQFAKGVGPHYSKVLAKKGIHTFEDALFFLPRTYEDRRQLTQISELKAGQVAQVIGKVEAARWRGKGRFARFEVDLSDGKGLMHLVWFHAYPSLKQEFQIGETFIVLGKVEFFGIIPQIAHPEFEKPVVGETGKPKPSLHFGRVVPIYSETEGFNQKTFRKIMSDVLKTSLDSLEDPLPSEMRSRLQMPSIRDSFVAIHFPKELESDGTPASAIKRIIFEEFFVLQLGLLLKKKKQRRQNAPVIKGDLDKFRKELPFQLTGDQNAAIEVIEKDLSSGKAMTRLIQGDVGSGKTVVALAASVVAAQSGYQTAIMAPTGILAEQHFKTAKKFLEPLGITAELLVSENSGNKELLKRVASGQSKVVIGTHALFQEGITFQKLGLVVVDEQHRFGVEQRAELLQKGMNAHLLMMTATPIPRTLALTLYGDLDLTLVKEKPANRKVVKTRIIRESDRQRLYQNIRARTQQGDQCFIIYPLVEFSEKLELKSATEMYEKLKSEIFPDLKLGILHGRMKAEEKDSCLKDFRDKKFDILVSTTVIEVGIDIPNATLMVVEHPERLGLSQLHQLRGRVGRGEKASDCILLASKYVSERLKILEQTDDGFDLAEEDLRIRGPGEFLGTRQSGLPGFRVGHVLRDADLLAVAKREAEELLDQDPDLSGEKNSGIRKVVEDRWKQKLDRLQV